MSIQNSLAVNNEISPLKLTTSLVVICAVLTIIGFIHTNNSKPIKILPENSAKAPLVTHPEKYALAKSLYLQSIKQQLAPPITVQKTGLWEKIGHSQSIKLASNKSVTEELNKSIKEKYWIEKNLLLAKPFLQPIVKEIQNRHLPIELALIPIIESSYNPNAQSKYKAVGLWQLIPLTAKELGLKITPWKDERKNIQLSTFAALTYLQQLHKQLGSWPMAIAAYNAGPARIRSRIEKAKINNPTAWDIKLPKETRRYLARFFALKTLLLEPNKYDFDIPYISNKTNFTEVTSPERISINTAAFLTKTPLKNLIKYNADLLTQSTPPNGPHKLWIPTHAVKQFKVALKTAQSHSINLYQPIVKYTVVEGDSLSEIASLHNTDTSSLSALNGLKSDKIKIGQSIIIFSGIDKNSTQASNIVEIPARYKPIKDTLLSQYTVKDGDTLSQIAQRFKVDIEEIEAANSSLTTAHTLKTGQTITLP